MPLKDVSASLVLLDTDLVVYIDNDLESSAIFE
jgi:hypothetical protein